MQSVWQSLIGLHSVIGLFLVILYGADRWLPPLETQKGRLLSGFFLGVVTIVTMTMDVEIQPGVRFDLHATVIAVSGMLFGPWSALVTGSMTALMHTAMDEGIVLPNLLDICISIAIGSAAHALLRGRGPGWPDCIALSLVVGLASVFPLPGDHATEHLSIINSGWLPFAALTFISTLLTSSILSVVLANRNADRMNEVYRDMVNALPDCLNAKDLAGRFIVANAATAELMKSGTANNLIGMTDFDFYPQKQAQKYREDDLSIIRSGEPRRFEQIVDFGNGQKGWLSSLKVPLKKASGEIVGLITYNQDITEHRAIHELRNEFISTVSHEIRTPLTSICGSLRLLQHSAMGGMPENAVKLINMANNNANHLMDLINNILDLEKCDSGRMNFEPEVVNLRAEVEDAVECMRHFLPDKKLVWEVSSRGQDSIARVHPGRLRQVMLNLLSNAAKFSPPGGRIEVELTIQNGMVDIAFLDQGKGVDPAFESSLFTRFSQETKNAIKGSKQGTGLGLNLVKFMVEHMSGDVAYRRRDGRTEFRISFPVHATVGPGDKPTERLFARAS